MNFVQYLSKRNICNSEAWISRCRDYDFVSLDIYGTSLIRLVEKPEDVFLRVEKRSGIIGYALERKKAQKAAMEKHGISTDIFDIYEELSEQIKLSDKKIRELIRFEIEEEKNCSIPNMAVIKLISDCKAKGKIVVFTSDMYLPSGILAEILKEKGLIGYDELIVSCEYGKSKGKGDLFRFVYDKYRHLCKRFVHFGDGRRTDFLNAKLCNGFSSILVRIPRESAYEKLLLYSNDNHETVYSWAYNYLGGLVYGFCQWMEKKLEAGGYKKAIFLTREGAYIKGYFDKYYTGKCETETFYVSRRAIVPAMADIDWEEFLFFLKGTSCRIGELADIFDLSLTEMKNVAQKFGLDESTPIIFQKNHCAFLEFLRPCIEEYSRYQRHLLIHYMKQLRLIGKVALVDIGWRGSMQADLQKIVDYEGLDIHFTGLYLGEYNVEGIECEKKGFLCSEEERDCIPDVINATYFFENAFLLQIGTTKRYFEEKNRVIPVIDNKPKRVDDRILMIQQAMERSFDQIIQYKGYIELDFEEVAKNALHTTNYPTYALACELGDIPWYDLNTVKYIAKPEPFLTYLRSPRKIIYDMQKSGLNSAFLRRLFKLPLPYFAVYKKWKNSKGSR